jgi:hypothetical protein
LTEECTTIEAGAITYGQLCSVTHPYLWAEAREITIGEYVSVNTTNCRGGLLSTVLSSTDGGQSDWFVPSIDQFNAAWAQKDLLGLTSVSETPDYWTVSQANEPDTAAIWFGNTEVWQYAYATYGESYLIAVRTF